MLLTDVRSRHCIRIHGVNYKETWPLEDRLRIEEVEKFQPDAELPDVRGKRMEQGCALPKFSLFAQLRDRSPATCMAAFSGSIDEFSSGSSCHIPATASGEFSSFARNAPFVSRIGIRLYDPAAAARIVRLGASSLHKRIRPGTTDSGARKVQEPNKTLFSDWGSIYMSEHSTDKPESRNSPAFSTSVRYGRRPFLISATSASSTVTNGQTAT